MPGSPSPPSRFLGFWLDIRDALSGKVHDYTSGSLFQAITVLAVPMMLEMVMESIFVVVDIYFLAKLGAEAVTAASLTEQALSLVYAVAIGLSMVASAMVARRCGEKKAEEANRTAGQAILLALLVSLPFALVGILFPRAILEIMGASPAVVELGWKNTALMVSSNAIIMLLYIINAIFRGAGDPLLSMKVLWFANGVNILLDPCLIFGYGPFPELGLLGAAVATTIGRGLGVLLQLWILFNGKKHLQVRLKQLMPDWSILGRMLRLSWWGIIQWLIATFSMTVLMRIAALFGSNAVAGYTIGFRVLIFVALPCWGLANAAATLVGQNLGAGKPERAEQSVRLAAQFNAVIMGLITLVFLFLGKYLVGFFTEEPEVLAYGVDSLRILGYSLVFYAVGIVYCQSFNGAGDTSTPTAIYFVIYWLIQIPSAYFMAVTFEMGANGVFISVSISQVLLAPLSYWLFRRGKWKTRLV